MFLPIQTGMQRSTRRSRKVSHHKIRKSENRQVKRQEGIFTLQSCLLSFDLSMATLEASNTKWNHYSSYKAHRQGIPSKDLKSDLESWRNDLEWERAFLSVAKTEKWKLRLFVQSERVENVGTIRNPAERQSLLCSTLFEPLYLSGFL